MVLLFRQLWQFQWKFCSTLLRAVLDRRARGVRTHASCPPTPLLIVVGFIGLSLWPNLALAAENLALGKPVIAAGATWPGLAVESLTDGQPATFTHPADGTDTTGYFFEVDCWEYLLERIVIRNRNDGCCPERLTRYHIEVYTDRGGETGALNGSTNVRADGSNSGVGGVDTVLASASPTQICQGRFIRVVNPARNRTIHNWRKLKPMARPVRASGYGASTTTRSTWANPRRGLQWEISNATWARIEPGIGAASATNGSVEIRPNATTTYLLTAGNTAGSVSSTVWWAWMKFWHHRN